MDETRIYAGPLGHGARIYADRRQRWDAYRCLARGHSEFRLVSDQQLSIGRLRVVRPISVVIMVPESSRLCLVLWKERQPQADFWKANQALPVCCHLNSRCRFLDD